MEKKEICSHTGDKPYPAGKTMKLKTFYVILAGIVVVIGAFFYYLYGYRYGRENISPLATPPALNNFLRPRFLFNIYGARGVKLVKPMAVFFDEKEKLVYVSNTEAHTVEVFKWQGEHVLTFGGFGSEPGRMSFPYGLARTRAGDLLVAEAGNRRVQRFSAKGEYLGTIFDQPNVYNIEKPGPLLTDSKGNIYIGDLSGGKVVVIDEQGKVIRRYGRLQYPHGLAVDEKNQLLYVSDSGTGEVKVFSMAGESAEVVKVISGAQADSGGTGFGIIRGIALDSLGRLYVVDSLAGTVKVFDSEGKYRFSFGSLGYDDGSMLYPNGIDVDDSGRIYIADWANNRVVVWGY